MVREDLYAKKLSVGIPSDIELDQFKKLLSTHVKPNDKVLVLGATAELRDIALSLGCKVFALDISLDMIYKREKVMTIRDPNNDVVARGNWLKPWFLQDHLFKAILGDAQFNNLLYDEMIKLFGVVRRLAAKNGVLIFRHANFYNAMPIAQIIELYKSNKISLRELGVTLYFHRMLKREYRDRKVDTCETFQTIIDELKKAGVSKDIQVLFEQHKFPGHHSVIEEQEFYRLLIKHFGNYRAFSASKLIYGRSMPLYLVKLR